MTPTFRRFLAVLSACGFAVSIIAYFESFSAPRADLIFRWWIVLLLGWVVLAAPIYILEYPVSRAWNFSFKDFARGMPNWVGPSARLLSLIAIAHLAWFALHAGRGVPAIESGRYVLKARGQILKVLTPAEYVSLRGAGERMFAAMMISFYFMPMSYWWFRRNQACGPPVPPFRE